MSCVKQNDSAMCMKVECNTCEKPTWKGCGKHIEEALKDVPEDERCKCSRDSPVAKTTATTVVKETEECKVETKVEVKSDEKPVATATELVKDETKAKED